jgi:hypothetical protein
MRLKLSWIEHPPSKRMVTGSNPVRRAIGRLIYRTKFLMVDVAQLVEPRIVIPVVAGSNPVIHPNYGA